MVIQNGQYSPWATMEAGLPLGSIIGPLLLLIYMDDLSENLASNPTLLNPTLFADDTSLFSVSKNVDASNSDLNNNFKKVGEWAFRWKMNFNPDPTKQAQELIFSHKVQMINYPPLFFNQNVVLQTSLKNI